MNEAPRRLDLAVANGFVRGDRWPGQGPGYLFLHGLGSIRAGEKSGSLVAHARRHGRAVARFDFRGHGESSGELGAVPVSSLVADTLRVLDELGPTVVVGASLGGLVGALAATARPDLVPGLCLIAPALGFLPRMRERLDAHGRLRTSDGHSFPVSAAVLADAAALDEEGLPARLAMPTLLVHGTADEVVPWQLGEAFHRRLPGPHRDLWLVPGGDHRLNTIADRIWPRLDALLSAAGVA